MEAAENKPSVTKKHFSNCYQAMPFPVIVTDSDTKVLFCNFAAKKTLPQVRSGSSLQKYSGFSPKKNMLLIEEVYGKRFFVSTAEKSHLGNKYLVISLLDSLFISEEKFCSAILESSDYLFREFCRMQDDLVHEETDFARFKRMSSRVCARVEKIREKQSIFLRFLKMTERKESTVHSCSMYNVFNTLAAKLCDADIALSVICPKTALAMVNLKDFSFVLLNIIQFIYLYTGDRKIEVRVSEKNDKCYISFEFNDRENLFSHYRKVLEKPVEQSVFPYSIAFTPLFCAIGMCRKYKNGFEVTRHHRKSCITVTAKSIHLLPDTYISAFGKRNESAIEELVENIYFL